MNDEERRVIAGIFDRLKQAADHPREAEAERFIAQKISEQPYAPYAMAQTIFVQEQALASLQRQNEALQAQVADQGKKSGGFLSSLFGNDSPPRPPQAPAPGYGQPQPGYGQQPQQGYQQAAQQPSGPWGGQPQGGYAPQQGGQTGPWGGQPQPMQRQGSGFLGTAMTTAAGVAGGMLVANALTSAFSGNHGLSADGITSGLFGSPATAAESLTGSNDASFSGGGADDFIPDNSQPDVSNASWEDDSDLDGSGGGDDWA